MEYRQMIFPCTNTQFLTFINWKIFYGWWWSSEESISNSVVYGNSLLGGKWHAYFFKGRKGYQGIV